MEISFSKITVDSITDSLKAGLKQAQLRQTVTRSLPSARVSNSLKGNIYSNTQLGITANDYEEVRVAWMEVPANATVASVTKDLEAYPEARLVRFLSSTPILSDDQILVAKNGLRGPALTDFNTKYGIIAGTAWGIDHVKFYLNNIAERQVIRYGEGNTEGKPANELVLSSDGKQQFRRVEFNPEAIADVDNRVTVEVKEFKSIDLAPNTIAITEAEKAVTA